MEDFRYRQLADQLSLQIEQGVLRAGERLPSVRQVSREQGLSLTTAFRAYYDLEARGLIVARPQSGYYVRTGVTKTINTPQSSRPQPIAMPITVSQVMRDLAKGWNRSELIDLAVTVPSLDLLPQAKLNKSLLAAVRRLPDSGLGYEDTTGFPELRRQIARLAFNGGSRVMEDDVVVTNGCIEAITLALRATTRPGDVVAIESPTYYGVLQAMEGLGIQAYELPTDPQTGPDLGILEQVLNTQPIRAVLLTPTFSNPTGFCMTDERKAQLVKLLADHDLPLIEDDIYAETYFSNVRPRTCHSFDTAGRVLLCSSVSKTLAPGYRVGWIIPGRYREAVIRAQLMQTISPATITQAAIADFLQVGRYDLHLRKLRAALQKHVLVYSDLVLTHFPAGTRISQPTGGFVLWVELPNGCSSSTLLTKAVEAGITFFPGHLFTTQEQYQNCLRLSCGHSLTAQYTRGIEELGRLCHQILA